MQTTEQTTGFPAPVLTAEEIVVFPVHRTPFLELEPIYFATEEAALSAAESSGRAFSDGRAYTQTALRLSDGRIVLFRSEPIRLHSDLLGLLRHNGLAKLTGDERRALGLSGDTEADHAHHH